MVDTKILEIHNKKPAIYGEVLFDILPGNEAKLGGAPFNVAWHLQGLGYNPLFISRVGQDERGQEVLKLMNNWNMIIEGLQQDPEHETGQVVVDFKNNQPHYNIKENQAYDHIQWEEAQRVVMKELPGLLYHGSLIYRSKESRETLNKLRSKLHLHTFVDLNLRAPWWDRELVEDILVNTSWLKVNSEELEEICRPLMKEDLSSEKKAKYVMDQYPLDLIIVTQGEKGSFVITKNQQIFVALPKRVAELADTIGAGDAFTAVFLIGLIEKWTIDESLQRATEFASSICQIQGALSHDPTFYRTYLQKWGVRHG